MKKKKSRLGALLAKVSSKLAHMNSLASLLHADISEFYSSEEFFINDQIPCLSDDFKEFNKWIGGIRACSDAINKKLEDEIRSCKVKISESRNHQKETYEDIVKYVQEKLN